MRIKGFPFGTRGHVVWVGCVPSLPAGAAVRVVCVDDIYEIGGDRPQFVKVRRQVADAAPDTIDHGVFALAERIHHLVGMVGDETPPLLA